MKPCVLDASVVAAAFFREPHSAAARALLASDREFHVPDLIYAEVASVFWKRQRRGEIDEAEADEPLGCKTIVERALAKGYWKTSGKTPQATVYATIIRRIAEKGDASRFRKADRGKFTLTK